MVYLKTKMGNDVNINLIAAKTKISPMKTVSIPRLELCGAVLLSKLIRKIKEAMDLGFITTYAWCDSEITLAWIKGEPHKYNIFVANRITEIQKEEIKWGHVNTKTNPADIASRGIYPHEIEDNKLWWDGPDFLINEQQIVSDQFFFTNLEVKKREIVNLNIVKSNETFFSISNNLNKIIRIVAYCKRFIKNCK